MAEICQTAARFRFRCRRWWSLMVLALAFTWPTAVFSQECTGGIPGYEASGVCCALACGTCGGDGCASIEGTNDGDCCVGDINAAGVSCSDTGVAPCVIDTSPTAAPATSPPSGAPQLAHTTASPTSNITGRLPSASPEPAVPTAPTSLTPHSPTLSPQTAIDRPSIIIPTIAPGSTPLLSSPVPMTVSESVTLIPTHVPSPSPVYSPTVTPTQSPIPAPTPAPTVEPNLAPTLVPAPVSTFLPTMVPTVAPTPAPTIAPTPFPTLAPTIVPTLSPALAPSEISFCSDGTPGIQSGDICCSVNCDVCGGPGCGSNSDEVCCTSDIEASGVICGEGGAVAPCIVSPTPSPILAPGATPSPPTLSIITPTPSSTLKPMSQGLDTAPPVTLLPTTLPPSSAPFVVSGIPTPVPSTLMPTPPGVPTPVSTKSPVDDVQPVEDPLCSNGMSGYQNSVVCCPVECGQCGGSGCDDILSTDDIQWYCCSDLVIIAGVYCNETVQPPCITGTVQDVTTLDDTSLARMVRVSSGFSVAASVCLALVIFLASRL